MASILQRAAEPREVEGYATPCWQGQIGFSGLSAPDLAYFATTDRSGTTQSDLNNGRTGVGSGASRTGRLLIAARPAGAREQTVPARDP